MGQRKREYINEYALYRGEKLVATGTINEIAIQLGIKEQTIRRYSTPAYKKSIVNESTGTFLVNLGRGSDEEENITYLGGY